MNIDKLILHVPGLMSKWHCDNIIDYYKSQKATAKYEGSYNVKTEGWSETTFKVVDLQPDTLPGQIVHDFTGKMIDNWCNVLYSRQIYHIMRPLLNFPHRHRILCYEEGTSIHQHIDWDHFIHGSCTFNLNDDYEGGIFSFFDGQLQYKLGLGDALIFPATPYWAHEVTPITKGTRYSTNTFITSMPEELRLEFVKKANEFIPK